MNNTGESSGTTLLVITWTTDGSKGVLHKWLKCTKRKSCASVSPWGEFAPIKSSPTTLAINNLSMSYKHTFRAALFSSGTFTTIETKVLRARRGGHFHTAVACSTAVNSKCQVKSNSTPITCFSIIPVSTCYLCYSSYSPFTRHLSTLVTSTKSKATTTTTTTTTMSGKRSSWDILADPNKNKVKKCIHIHTQMYCICHTFSFNLTCKLHHLLFLISYLNFGCVLFFSFSSSCLSSHLFLPSHLLFLFSFPLYVLNDWSNSIQFFSLYPYTTHVFMSLCPYTLMPFHFFILFPFFFFMFLHTLGYCLFRGRER